MLNSGLFSAIIFLFLFLFFIAVFSSLGDECGFSWQKEKHYALVLVPLAGIKKTLMVFCREGPGFARILYSRAK